MPLGEVIGELLLRGVFEIIFLTASYYTGAVALWIISLGQLRIAPLSTIEQPIEERIGGRTGVFGCIDLSRDEFLRPSVSAWQVCFCGLPLE